MLQLAEKAADSGGTAGAAVLAGKAAAAADGSGTAVAALRAEVGGGDRHWG